VEPLKIFSNDLADDYARQPVKIGSRVYANRMGNGDEKSQEGYFFRGRGALQTTGKINYLAFSKFIKDPKIMKTPDLLATDYSLRLLYFSLKKIIFGLFVIKVLMLILF
jgi:putative chitinase